MCELYRRAHAHSSPSSPAAVVDHDQDSLEKLIAEGGDANGFMDADTNRTLLHEAAKLGYATVRSPFAPRRPAASLPSPPQNRTL